MSSHSVVRYESGERVPPDETVGRIADVLGFPKGFFFEPDIDEPQEGSASFRSLSSMLSGEGMPLSPPGQLRSSFPTG